MSATPDPMEAIRKLGERLQEIGAEIGLDLKTFIPVVDFEHEGGHVIQAVFVYNEPVAVASLEQQEFDTAFKDIERQFSAEAVVDTQSDAVAKMLETRNRMKRGDLADPPAED